MNKMFYNGQLIVDFDELADKYTKAEVDALVSSVFKYKGTVATRDDLENIVEKSIGDCYNVEADGTNYAWNGEEWGALSGTVDLTSYYTKEQIDGKFGSYLAKNNSIEYTPTADYHPATKKYVDNSAVKGPQNIIYLPLSSFVDSLVSTDTNILSVFSSLTNNITIDSIGKYIIKPYYDRDMLPMIEESAIPYLVKFIGTFQLNYIDSYTSEDNKDISVISFEGIDNKYTTTEDDKSYTVLRNHYFSITVTITDGVVTQVALDNNSYTQAFISAYGNYEEAFTPYSDCDPVSKKYVDDTVSTLATEDYVNNAIANSVTEEYVDNAVASKSTVYVQSSQPTNAQTGDIWIIP